MFLFTTPNPAPSPSPAPAVATPTGTVVDAIRQGAISTGTDFDYLLKTAKRESALDPAAKAPTSSATGLFQFIEQTWLGLVKSDGDKLGLASEAKAVVARPDGGYTVADPEARQAILKLREEPAVASAMAGALTRQNRDALVASTGREPSAGELYMAHVLGARGASDLISTASADPGRAAASGFPEAARANRGIFYERGGRPRSAGEVYSLLAAAQSGAGGGATAQPVAVAAATPAADARPPGLHGLFQTGSRAGPLSDAVARIWRTNNDGSRTRPVAASFFPRSGTSGDDVADTAAPAAAEIGRASEPAAMGGEAAAFVPVAADVPLPPVRPSFIEARSPGRAPAPAILARTNPKASRS